MQSINTNWSPANRRALRRDQAARPVRAGEVERITPTERTILVRGNTVHRAKLEG